MERIIYHGSERIIHTPFYGGGKEYNDYGKGFYCTESPDMAKEWAAGRERSGFACRYVIEEEGLSILNLNDPDYNILNWLQILLENRTFDSYSLLAEEAREYMSENFAVPYDDYDVLIGYRADDSYFSFAQDFLNGAITLNQLKRAMMLGRLGEQYVLKSRKAFECIIFKDYEVASHEEWYLKRMQRDRRARAEYFDMEKNRRKPGDLFISDIIDLGIKNDDERLR